MSTPGTMSAALAFVPNWWAEATDASAFDALFASWARACGWHACGFVWSGDNTVVVKTVQAGGYSDAPAPLEMPDALRRLKSGEATVVYSIPGMAGRVFAGIQPAGRPLGVLWAEKAAGQAWAEGDRAYLALAAKTIERSPALAALIGPVIDPDRLYQRLGDVATIAGRMAHDFDNLLQGIIGFSDLTLPLLTPGSQPAGFVGEIGKVGQRGIQFTQQLHHLSRSGQVKPNPSAVPLAVTKEEMRLKPAIPAGVRVEKQFSANVPPVAVEAGPLQLVIGHLLENAIEACSATGVVQISTSAVELSDADGRNYLGRVGIGGYLQITIADTGPGIKPDVRRRLFVEPFFTTKVRHRGLGLAIVYRVLCAHRGGIQIESIPLPGTGTQVRIVLPLAAARPSSLVPIPVPRTATAVGG